MITRIVKLLLLAGVALFYSLVVFNNLTDFNSNYQLVPRYPHDGHNLFQEHGNVGAPHVINRRLCVLHRYYRLEDRDGNFAAVGIRGALTRHPVYGEAC